MTYFRRRYAHQSLAAVAAVGLLMATAGQAWASPPSGSHPLPGINLAGAEFAAKKTPGRYGWDYIYPNAGEVNYFAAKGMKLFRVPMLWERIQPALEQKLDPNELARLKSLAASIHQTGGVMVIDVHDYGHYDGVNIGTSAVPTAAYIDLWTRLAQQFGADDYVAFGLMNEPQLPQANDWAAITQQAITAIRSTGATNRIMVSGIGWDGAAGFAALSGPSLGNLADPQNRLIYEVHQYFDKDASGTSPVCIPPAQAVQRLVAFTQWLRAGHREGYLGEFGVSASPDCLMILQQTLAYMQANADVWWGWTYWAAGPLWGKYMYSAEPVHGQDSAQMKAMEPYLSPISGQN